MKRIQLYRVALVWAFIASFLSDSFAQPYFTKSTRTYDVWIRLKDNRQTLNGKLYEIRDSAVLISNCSVEQKSGATKTDSLKIEYGNIDFLKVRPSKNFSKGITIGSVSGFISGVTIVSIIEKDLGIYVIGPALYGGAAFGVLAGGTGALFGLSKDKIPVEGSIGNLNLYRSWLEKYAIIHNYPVKTKFFEHKGFFGFQVGVSFPTGNFTYEGSEFAFANNAKTGFTGNYCLGFRFNKNLGTYLLSNSAEFPVNDDAYTYWSIGGFTAGPLVTFPLMEKIFIDLKPGIGYTSAYLVVDNLEVKTGNGIGANFSASLNYHFAKRWDFVTEIGYFYTRQEFKDNSKGNFRLINSGAGFTYRFGRTSL